MKIEPLYGVIYKITINSDEKNLSLKRLVAKALEKLTREYENGLSEDEVQAQRFTSQSGDAVLILSRTEPSAAADSFFACDIRGAFALGALCRALVREKLHISENIRVYVASSGECFRAVLKNPSERASELCGEFGDYCEITELFAAQTAENLAETARGEEIAKLAEALS